MSIQAVPGRGESVRIPRLVAALVAASLAGLGSASAQVTLVNVAAARNVDVLGYGRGTAMVDFDGDGLLDLFVLNDALPRVALRQLPNHDFQDVTAAWGIAPTTTDDWALVSADFDNDGDDDLFVGTGGLLGLQPNALLRNDIATSGVFTDVSAQAGAITLSSAVFGATALDYDSDGLLDLYFCDAWNGTTPGNGHLLHNDGGLVFSDVSVAKGIAATADYRHCSTGDIDNDGDLDIGAGGFSGNSRLWRNDAGATFVDVAPSFGISSVVTPFGMVLEDFDQDGWMDIYLPLYQKDGVTQPSKLYRNLQGTSFADSTAGSGMTGQLDMGHNVFDLDDDGYFEIYVGTGSPPTPYLDRLLAVFPDGAGGFDVQDWSAASGVESIGLTRTHGTACGDFDEDGDIDIYCNTGGAPKNPLSLEYNVLFENQGHSNAWIEAALQGVVSNRTAVGAKVAAHLPSGRISRRTLLAGRGFGNTDSHIVHVGLGAEANVQRLVVTWPSGIEQVLLAPPAFERHVIVETGLRLFGTPAPGSTFTLQGVGPGGNTAVMLLAGSAAEVAMTKFGGVLHVAPPLLGLIPLSLPAAGVLDLPVTLPNDPLLSGVTLYLQSWTHPPAAVKGPTLTNLVTLAIQ